jgi:hypothetical protein
MGRNGVAVGAAVEPCVEPHQRQPASDLRVQENNVNKKAANIFCRTPSKNNRYTIHAVIRVLTRFQSAVTSSPLLPSVGGFVSVGMARSFTR